MFQWRSDARRRAVDFGLYGFADRESISFLVIASFGLRLQEMLFQIVLWVVVAILCIPVLVAVYWFVVQRNR